MKVMSRLVCATLIIVGLLGHKVAVAAFGESIIGSEQAFLACQDQTILSIPVAITAPSRLFLSATVAYTNTNSLATFFVRVTGASGTQVLGTSMSVTGMGNSLTAQSVAHAGATPILPGATPLTLTPGSYQIQLRGRKHSGCGIPGGLDSSVLSYLILSGLQDLIFASGFS